MGFIEPIWDLLPHSQALSYLVRPDDDGDGGRSVGACWLACILGARLLGCDCFAIIPFLLARARSHMDSIIHLTGSRNPWGSS